jgi:hypothetical protein
MENDLLDDVCGTRNEKIDTVLEIVVEIYISMFLKKGCQERITTETYIRPQSPLLQRCWHE